MNTPTLMRRQEIINLVSSLKPRNVNTLNLICFSHAEALSFIHGYMHGYGTEHGDIPWHSYKNPNGFTDGEALGSFCKERGLFVRVSCNGNSKVEIKVCLPPKGDKR